MFNKRSDGRLLKTLDPFSKIIPFMMETRSGSMNRIDLTIDIEKTYDFLSQNEDITLFHVVLASLVRTISQRPALNRFASGRRLYARNSIDLTFALKRKFADDGEETTVKIRFEPTDTVFDVAKRVDERVALLKDGLMEDDDKLIAFLTKLPRGLTRAVIDTLKWLEYHNMMPKAVIDLDPFHATAFVANHGSIGLTGLDHHLYDWGTNSIFVAMSGVINTPAINRDGSVERKRSVILSVSCDDRICDGYYYGKSAKILKNLIENPTKLAEKPETVVNDID